MIVLLTIFNLDTLNLRGEKHYKQFVILFWFLNWKKKEKHFFYLQRVFAQDWQVCLVNAKKIQTILTIKSFFTLKLVRRFFCLKFKCQHATGRKTSFAEMWSNTNWNFWNKKSSYCKQLLQFHFCFSWKKEIFVLVTTFEYSKSSEQFLQRRPNFLIWDEHEEEVSGFLWSEEKTTQKTETET
jgi:hypothetical protein